jgi:hypothetical protein
MTLEEILRAVQKEGTERWCRYCAAGDRAAAKNPEDPHGARNRAIRQAVVDEAVEKGWISVAVSPSQFDAEAEALEVDLIFNRRLLADAFRMYGVRFLEVAGPMIAAKVELARWQKDIGTANEPWILQRLEDEALDAAPGGDEVPEPVTTNARRSVELFLDEVRRSIAPPASKKKIHWSDFHWLLPKYDALPKGKKAKFRENEAERLGLSVKYFSRALETARAERKKTFSKK